MSAMKGKGTFPFCEATCEPGFKNKRCMQTFTFVPIGLIMNSFNISPSPFASQQVFHRLYYYNQCQDQGRIYFISSEPVDSIDIYFFL